jgi:signal transduction histidine kinase/ActR/RegA family two-component response regulator
MNLNDEIYADQIRLLSENIPRGLLMQSLLATLLAIIAYTPEKQSALITWLSFFYSVSLFRYFLHLRVFPPALGKTISIRTRYLYVSGSLLSGIAWASALFFLKPSSVADLLLITMALVGVMAGGISVLSYLVESYAAFSLPIAASVGYSFLTMGSEVTEFLGYMLLLYVISCLYFSRVFNKVLIETLLLQHKNDELLKEIKQEKEVAEQANLAKSKFLAAASHDLRQPLHALSLLFEAVKETKSNSTRKTLYPKIDTSIDALSSLFNSLLDISKLDAGIVKPTMVTFSLRRVIDSIVSQYEPEARNKGLKLRVHCHDAIVRSDRIFIERILINLLSNAIRYTNTGGILISCRSRNDSILLQVWDTGIGIRHGEREAVFNEFHQLHNPQRDRKQGLGLGLSIVKRLCDLLDCELELSSRLGTGTTVSVLLPKGNQADVKLLDDIEPKQKWELTGLRVLVIDDDDEVLKATSVLLNNWGCDIDAANSSANALELSKSMEPPGFIISDLRLPGKLNGVQLVDQLLNQYSTRIPVILITGDTDTDRILLTQKSGYKILHKPIKPAQLRTAMRMMLKTNSARK